MQSPPQNMGLILKTKIILVPQEIFENSALYLVALNLIAQ